MTQNNLTWRIFFKVLFVPILLISLLVIYPLRYFYDTKVLNTNTLVFQVLFPVTMSFVSTAAAFLLNRYYKDGTGLRIGLRAVRIKVPLMLACAPLFISRKMRFFEDNRLDVEIDFRYAGINALKDLRKVDCDFAVASDVAIISYL